MGEELLFKQGPEVKGVDFGRQLLLHALRVEQLQVNDVWEHILKHGEDSTGALSGSEIIAYAPTRTSKIIQIICHTLTLGIATSRAKVLLFQFNSPDLKEKAERDWPKNVSLERVKRHLLTKLPECELARLKVWKGQVTFYLYVVKKRGSPLQIHDQFSCLLVDVLAAGEVKDYALLGSFLSKSIVSGGYLLLVSA